MQTRLKPVVWLTLVAASLGGCASSPNRAGPNAGATAPLGASTVPAAGAEDKAAANVPPPPPPAAVVPPVSKPTLGQEMGAVAQNKVEILFPEGGSTISPDAEKQLDLAVRLFRDANPVVMFTTGYTDRSGDEYANLLLSARRAQAVKRALVERGLPEDRLLIQALGESELADTSNPASAENRRVLITWRLL